MSNSTLIIRPKKLKGDDGYRTFSVRIRQDLIDRIDDIAEQSGRSRNEIISLFIEFASENCRVES